MCPLNQFESNSEAADEKVYTLLTGATGLVGQYLMRDLLRSGAQLAVIVRPKKKEPVEVRIERILQYWELELECQIPRPVILAGDISEPNLGLDEQACQWVKQNCGSIIHNAAILQFNGADRQREPWKTNVGGTGHALQLADDCGIRNLHYVSTAYVCGNRDTTIMESDFDDSLGFRNDYERSKFAAEKLVRNADHFDKVTIYRPVVIAGDSQSGFTSTYHGLYVYLRLFALFIPEQERDQQGKILTPVKVPMEGDEPRNVVPVDWISDVFCKIFHNPKAHGRTFHMAPDKCLTPSQVIDACYEFFNSHGVEFCGEAVPDEYEQPDFAKQIFENIAIYQQYESHDPTFDTTNLKTFAGDLPCPPIDAETIHRYLSFGDLDNWGKKKRLVIAEATC